MRNDSGKAAIIVVAFILAIAVGVIFIGQLVKQPETATASEIPSQSNPVPIIDTHIHQSAQIAYDFDNNEVRANSKYRGKVLFLSGMVSEISTDMFDTAHIELASPIPISSVRCSFDKEQTNSLAKLNRGAHVVISGQVQGKFVYSVMLKHCALEEVRYN